MRIIVASLIVLGLILAGVMIVLSTTSTPERVPDVAPPSSSTSSRSYSSLEYGVTFTYPATYRLAEKNAEGSGERLRHIVTLIHESDLPTPQNGEGPPAITIEMFQNNLDQLGTEEWIRNSSASNFKLSLDDTLSSTTVAGQSALAFTWDGLYRGDTIAIARSDYVYVFSVTYRDAADPIRDDFENVMRAVSFE